MADEIVTLDPTKTVIIGVNGGLVQWILSDVPGLKAVVMDYDTEGSEGEVCGQVGVDGPLSKLEPEVIEDLKGRGYVIGQ